MYVRNVVDQVDTNGTVFLGLTTGCARCHDHKYDPIRAKDYYQLFAFFNNIDGPPMDGNGARWAPVVPVPSPKQEEAMRADQAEIARLQQAKSETLATLRAAAGQLKDDDDPKPSASKAEFVWIDVALPEGASPQCDGPWEFLEKPGHPVFSGRACLAQSGRKA